MFGEIGSNIHFSTREETIDWAYKQSGLFDMFSKDVLNIIADYSNDVVLCPETKQVLGQTVLSVHYGIEHHISSCRDYVLTSNCCHWNYPDNRRTCMNVMAHVFWTLPNKSPFVICHKFKTLQWDENKLKAFSTYHLRAYYTTSTHSVNRELRMIEPFDEQNMAQLTLEEDLLQPLKQ